MRTSQLRVRGCPKLEKEILELHPGGDFLGKKKVNREKKLKEKRNRGGRQTGLLTRGKERQEKASH